MVSVIIPVFNRYPLLQEAAASVLAQSHLDFELVIVDDGSEDETAELTGGTDGFFRDVRVKIIHVKHSGMPGLVRNIGAGAAQGSYLAFLDSDDLWEQDKLKLQAAFFQDNPDLRICHTRERWIRKGKEISQAGQKHRREGMIFQDALEKCIIGPSTVMMERSLFQETRGFREDLEIAEDYEYWLRITPFHEIGYIDLPLIEKRAGHGGQLSEKYGHIEYFRIQGLKDLVDRNYFPEEQQTSARQELARKCGIYAAGCEKRGKKEDAAEYSALQRKYS